MDMFTHNDRDLYILSCFINKLGNRGNSQDKIVERVQKKKLIIWRTHNMGALYETIGHWTMSLLCSYASVSLNMKMI